MNFYGNRLGIRHPEALACLTRAEKELQQGVSLLKTGIKVKDKRLPTHDDI